MSLDSLRAARQDAGARYTAAVAELEASLKELAALDIAMANGKFAAADAHGPWGFGSHTPDATPEALVHAQFLPARTHGWLAAISARAERLLRDH